MFEAIVPFWGWRRTIGGATRCVAWPYELLLPQFDKNIQTAFLGNHCVDMCRYTGVSAKRRNAHHNRRVRSQCDARPSLAAPHAASLAAPAHRTRNTLLVTSESTASDAARGHDNTHDGLALHGPRHHTRWVARSQSARRTADEAGTVRAAHTLTKVITASRCSSRPYSGAPPQRQARTVAGGSPRRTRLPPHALASVTS
eukprot:899893-Prymnesium_polylepis.1